jgi:hypothetical protein
MKLTYYILSAIFLLLSFLAAIWYPVFAYYTYPPVEKGPSTELVSTEGAFTPGGVIKFTFKTNVDSLHGLYSGNITFTPESTIWSSQTRKGGSLKSTWGDIIKGRGTKEIVMTELLQIPENRLLINKTIPIKISIDLLYPYGEYDRFSDYIKHIDDKVYVSIKPSETSMSFPDLNSA